MKSIFGFLLGVALAASAAAQTRVVTLGTQGGPLPSLTRSQPANALVVRDRIYLVDAGNGVAHQLLAAGLDHRKVERIFITHNHDDHNADWGTLMGLQWSTGRRAEVHVYGPAGTESMLQGFLQYFAPNARIRMGDSKAYPDPRGLFHAHDIAGPGQIYKDDLVTVTAVENCHFAHGTDAQRDAQDKSYALRFQTPDRVVVFSGDTGRCAGLDAFAKDADVLVHEVIDLPLIEKAMRRELPPEMADGLMRHMTAEHTTAEDVGRLAQAAKVRKVVLTHVIPGRDEPDSVYTDAVKKHYDGPAVVARDLMTF
ncbi:MBL fold metallo-hydrolase [Variovorax sp. YR216]|uniref:MBL fold metallo-hydrolase n=1 Tax=Variovorax sp. YR216 TaxID=1882828 RepID=UPI0008962A31|nr:MBL fold metallo-hydrolase [Variovorax sp. YR216]SEB15972.1 Ribonuclease BN, tRNA processing enzyme [Variovorax sp. YR216]